MRKASGLWIFLSGCTFVWYLDTVAIKPLWNLTCFSYMRKADVYVQTLGWWEKGWGGCSPLCNNILALYHWKACGSLECDPKGATVPITWEAVWGFNPHWLVLCHRYLDVVEWNSFNWKMKCVGNCPSSPFYSDISECKLLIC